MAMTYHGRRQRRATNVLWSGRKIRVTGSEGELGIYGDTHRCSPPLSSV